MSNISPAISAAEGQSAAVTIIISSAAVDQSAVVIIIIWSAAVDQSAVVIITMQILSLGYSYKWYKQHIMGLVCIHFKWFLLIIALHIIQNNIVTFLRIRKSFNGYKLSSLLKFKLYF